MCKKKKKDYKSYVKLGILNTFYYKDLLNGINEEEFRNLIFSILYDTYIIINKNNNKDLNYIKKLYFEGNIFLGSYFKDQLDSNCKFDYINTLTDTVCSGCFNADNFFIDCIYVHNDFKDSNNCVIVGFSNIYSKFELNYNDILNNRNIIFLRKLASYKENLSLKDCAYEVLFNTYKTNEYSIEFLTKNEDYIKKFIKNNHINLSNMSKSDISTLINTQIKKQLSTSFIKNIKKYYADPDECCGICGISVDGSDFFGPYAYVAGRMDDDSPICNFCLYGGGDENS